MSADLPSSEGISVVQEPGPNELRDPMVRAELKRASVWFGLAITVALVVLLIQPHHQRDGDRQPEPDRGALELKRASVWFGLAITVALVVLLIQPLLIIFAGLVFASLLDGGARLLGKVLPIPRGLRILIVVLLATAFVFGVFYLTGVEIAQQASQLQATLEFQANRLVAWISSMGLMPGRTDIGGIVQQALGSVGRLTSAVGTVLGAGASMLMIVSIGLFVALEPRIYERGLQWMVPLDARDQFSVTIARMARTLRVLLAGRLLGMAAEGIFTWFFLALAGVPMALLLGILTGMLAFIPNIGAFVSGVLMVAVGFSAGYDTGIWAIIIYFGVQTFDGYVLIPLVAKRTVDLPPALTLGAQILASTLFGIMGLALADPMVAMIKVALESEAERAANATSLARRGRWGRRRGSVAEPEAPGGVA